MSVEPKFPCVNRTIPDYQTLMLPLLKRAEKKDIRVPEIEEEIAKEFGLSTIERDQLSEWRQKVPHNRLHWAKFYLSKAGLVSPAGKNCFVATEAGRQLLTSKPQKIDNGPSLKYPDFQKFYYGNGATDADKSSGSNAPASAPALAATSTLEE